MYDAKESEIGCMGRVYHCHEMIDYQTAHYACKLLVQSASSLFPTVPAHI